MKNLSIYLLNKDKYEGVINYPVIKIKFLSPPISFDKIDYLIFTSKNGVRAIDNLTNEWKNIPSIAIGNATAKEIKKLNGKIDYISNSGYGENLAKEIDKKYKNKTFLWLRPKNVVTNLKEYIKNNALKELIVYETTCNKPDFKIKKPSIIIFTSPSTVECFSKIENFNNIISIAIGKKTYQVLQKYTSNILMPKKPSIIECINIAKNVKF